MKIRGEQVLLPPTMVGFYPRPHWLTGKVLGESDKPDIIARSCS